MAVRQHIAEMKGLLRGAPRPDGEQTVVSYPFMFQPER